MTWVRRCMGVATACVLAMPATSQAEGDWEGSWATAHKFGTPTLRLQQERKSDPGPQVSGTFRNGSGERTGTIRGDLGRQGLVWSGTYKDNATGDKGKFRVQMTEPGFFEGWFKSCGRVLCDPRIEWAGQKFSR